MQPMKWAYVVVEMQSHGSICSWTSDSRPPTAILVL